MINNARIALDVKDHGKHPLCEIMKWTYEVNVLGAVAVIDAFVLLLAKTKDC
jgi:hypothetical protein